MQAANQISRPHGINHENEEVTVLTCEAQVTEFISPAANPGSMLGPVRLSYVIAAFDYGDLTLQVHRSLLASRLVSAFIRLWLVNSIAIQPGCCLSCGRPVVELHPLEFRVDCCQQRLFLARSTLSV